VSFLFQPIPTAGESLSASPTNTTTTLLNQAPIGYESTDTPTLGKMQAGSFAMKWVVLIEGCPYVPTDCNSTAAVRTALADTDWSGATIIPGLFVEMQNTQSIDPYTAFSTSGRCTLRIMDTDGNDTFGTYVAKRLSGAETEITATADRNDTTVSVKSTTGFTSSGDAWLGTECIGYTGVTSTSFTGVTRGKYSPFGCASSGAGGSRFANNHRWGVDARYIQQQPLVTQLPRVWLGRRVALYLHTWDGTNLNSRVNAQLVYAGRIVGIADDPGSFTTVLDLEHFSKEWENGVIGADLYQADMVQGLWLAAGRTFKFLDSTPAASRTANDLVVVSSGAAGANQMNEGTYSLSELVEKINGWLASEATASRTYGNYTLSSPVAYKGDGIRTVIQWYMSYASAGTALFQLQAPIEVCGFLGFMDVDPVPGSGQMGGIASSPSDRTNTANMTAGVAAPYTAAIFHPVGPGHIGQEFTEALNYDVENERGTFTDQRDTFPAALKELCPAGNEWGLFLVDDKALMCGAYDSTNHRFTNCFLAPYQMTADNGQDALKYIGRRADEPQAPITLRQVFLIEGSFSTIFKQLAYSTGVSGYNHTSDTLGNSLGLGIPGSLLGDKFDRSVDNLQCADAPISVLIDEPTKFSELMSADLMIRRAFVRWRDEGFEVCQWQTPVAAAAVLALSEDNKAAPAGHLENHRTASQETDEYQRPSVKIDYCRDFASGRDAKYLKSIQIEDQGATDQSGEASGRGGVFTLKMRNTFQQFSATGAPIESLAPHYMATMPMFSRPAKQLSRSIDLRYFEGYSVGDIVTVDDSYARDPLTGRRSITQRPAVITKISYNLGGPSPDGQIRPMGGTVELAFLDLHRGSLYSPAADIDDTCNFGGFSAGYNSATKTIRCYPQHYSHSVVITFKQWQVTIAEPADALNFAVGDKVAVVERDPADPASPTTWSDTIASVSENDIGLTTGLSAPAWDAAKRYRIISAAYTTATATQQDDVYQADVTDMLIQDLDPPYHFAVTQEQNDYNENG
jgi:hypothetical protein